MPIYEYQCTACQREFEVIQRFSDLPLQHCEACGGTLEKKISPAAFHLKGSGWYVTDYARKGSSGSTESGSKKTENSASSSTTTGSTAASTTPAAGTGAGSSKS